VLESVAGEHFFNTSPSTSPACSTTQDRWPATCGPTSRLQLGAREVIDKFDFDVQITRLAGTTCSTGAVALRRDRPAPATVSNIEMGYSTRSWCGVLRAVNETAVSTSPS